MDEKKRIKEQIKNTKAQIKTRMRQIVSEGKRDKRGVTPVREVNQHEVDIGRVNINYDIKKRGKEWYWTNGTKSMKVKGTYGEN